jgi:hypothetical protein
VIKYNILTVYIVQFAQLLAKGIPDRGIIDDSDARNPPQVLLRTRGEWPRECHAAKNRNEIPSPHDSPEPEDDSLAHPIGGRCASQQKQLLDFRNGSFATDALGVRLAGPQFPESRHEVRAEYLS